MKEIIIFYEDWIGSIEKWLRIFYHPKLAVLIESAFYLTKPCGLCQAMDRCGFENLDKCMQCLAYPEICGHESSVLWEKIIKNRTSWRMVREGSVEIIRWLQELGMIAGWESKRLEIVLGKAKEYDLNLQARKEVTRIMKRQKLMESHQWINKNQK